MTNGSGRVPRNPRLANDLAALAKKERSRLGEPPTAEQLIAYRDGKLAEDEAERIRDRLAVDPQWAAIYLDLKREPDPKALASEVPDGAVSDAEVDDGWRALAGKLDQDVSPIVEPELEASGARPHRWRYPKRMLLSMAAMLIMGLGLAWMLAGPRRQEPQPAGRYPLVQVTTVQVTPDLRTLELQVPDNVAGLRLLIDAAEFPSPGEYRIEVLDVAGVAVWGGDVNVKTEQVEVTFLVPSSVFVEGKTYRLTARSSGASKATEIWIFAPRFVPQPEVPSGVCIDLDRKIDRGADLRKAGDRQAAEDLYLEILDLAGSAGCLYQEARIQNGLATLAIVEGRLIDSLDLLELASEMDAFATFASNLGQEDRKLKETIELNRGVAYLRLGWFDEALVALKRVDDSYRLRHGVEPEKRAKLSLQLAGVQRLLGKMQAARATIQESLAFEDISHTHEAAMWLESARIDLEAGRLDAAERSFDQAIDAAGRSDDKFAKANVVSDLAELKVAQGKWLEGLQKALEALEIVSGTKKLDLNLEIHARYLQSLALEGLGRREEARQAADSGLALLESLRGVWRDQGIQFFGLRQKYYRHRLDLAAAGTDAEDAWIVIEGHRAQSLLDSAAVRARRPGHRDTALDLDALEQAQRELLAAIRQLEDWEPSAGEEVLSAAEEKFLSRRVALRVLQATERRTAGLEAPPSEIGIIEAGEMLDAETLGLIFASGKDSIHILAVARHIEPKIISLSVDGRRIQNLTSDILKSLEPHTPRQVRESLESRATELSRILLAPLDENLGKFRRLVIAAEGALATLPFEVLRHPRTGQRLVESHEVAYVPSFSVLAAMRHRTDTCAEPTGDLVAMGDPIFGANDGRWPPNVTEPRNAEESLALFRLEATAGEVKAIAELFSKGVAYEGAQAVRQHLLDEASAHRTIHVASHAWSDPQQPERSKIALSCIDAEGRVPEVCDLYFVDVLNLELCGQTVVLSACNTAGGPAVEGEGVLGMPWAFLRAGASTVVASLWQVTDETTAELMSAFHGYLAKGRQPSEALRLAKLDLIGANRPASAWAPFVVLGDWR